MITSQDLALVLFLAFLEGILSIDNALVLAMMTRHLPKKRQRQALTYGLGGAILFRLLALSLVTYLIRWTWVKFVGGAYLIGVALKHLVFASHGSDAPDRRKKKATFWKTVLMIEVMDIAFAVDSILAAVAVSQKVWIVFFGGFIGVIMMRFAAVVFLRLLERFPNFESTAYALVLVIGIKLVVDGFHFPAVDFQSHDNPAFWAFWGIVLVCILAGFRPKRKSG